MANRPAGFYSQAKRLAQDFLSAQEFLKRYQIEFSITSFAVRRDFPERQGNHYVVFLASIHGSWGTWVTGASQLTIEEFLAGLRRELRWERAAGHALESHLVESGVVKSFNEATPIAQQIRDNVNGFRWAFGNQAAEDLIRKVAI